MIATVLCLAFQVALSDAQHQRLDNVIDQASVVFHVPKEMIEAVIHEESRHKPSAVSSAGCVGLMQLAPATAKEVAKELGMRYYNLRNIEHSVILGTAYLSKLYVRYGGSWLKALTAYNMGPSAFRRGKHKISDYARRVYKKYLHLKNLSVRYQYEE